MLTALLLVATAAVSLATGYWLGSPTVIEQEKHEHTHNDIESIDMLDLTTNRSSATIDSYKTPEITRIEIDEIGEVNNMNNRELSLWKRQMEER